MSTQDHSPRTTGHNSIQFGVKCETSFGQEVRICGNSMELGNWNPLLGHRLVTDNKSYPYWKSFLPLIVKNLNKIEYKACIISNNRVTWQRNIPNRQIQCQHPSQITFTFNQPKQTITQKLITQITCKQGLLDILQEMDDSETSSIQFKSNYPLENYFLPGRTSLELSRGLSGSQSSNLFSPGQQLMASDEYDQFQQDAFGPQYEGLMTPPPFKLQTRRTQVYTRSNDYRQLFSTQDFLQRRSDHSRSHSGQKSQSGSQKGNQQPMSPFIIHVPSIEGMGHKINKHQQPSYSPKNTSDSKQNENQDDNKSTTTIMQFDTENQYLTTRDNDVVIEKQVPSYNDV